MALLRLLVEWRRAFGRDDRLEILAGHVNHGIRGDEADRDAAFVAAEARLLGVELLLESVSAPAEAERRKLSLEDAARQLRYGVFGHWALERDLDAVAAAHHLDDQAETLILHGARGAGLRGIAGMPSDRPLLTGARARLIRPLLDWRRSDLLAFLTEVGASWRVDATNDDPTIRRNAVRHQVLPALEAAVHPGAREALARLAGHARRVSEDLALLGERAVREAIVSEDDTSCALSVAKLREWPGSVIHEALALVLAELDGPRLSSRVSEEAQRWVLSVPSVEESSCDLSGVPGAGVSLRLELRYGLLRVWRPPELEPPPDPGCELSVPGSVEWGGWTIRTVETEASPETGAILEPGAIRERVDADAVRSLGRLAVRSRRLGERFRPLGAPGSTKLKEFFRAERVRPEERDRVPIVDAAGEIVWVVGHRIAESFRVTEATRRVLVLDAIRHAGPGSELELPFQQPAPPPGLQGEEA